MKYDIFLVSTLADLEKAGEVARRLRALKFKVRFDKARTHTVATPKDIKDANESRQVLVLWSKTACDTTKADSDWVHALAHQARARDGALIQVALDKSTPDEPFDKDERITVFGLAPRKKVPAFTTLAVLIGERLGRPGLADWLSYTTHQKEEREAWKAAHPDDPLALVGKKKPASKPAKPKTQSKAKTKTPAKVSTKTTAPAAKKTAATMPIAEVNETTRVLRPKTPPLKLKPPTPPVPPEVRPSDDRLIIGLICAGIAAMFFFGYQTRAGTNTLPAIANAGPALLAQCPPGQVPAGLLEPLGHGEIIDDTE